MVNTIDNRLENIENFLKRIESRIDNFTGLETLFEEESKELIKIKKEMSEGKSHSYDGVFN